MNGERNQSGIQGAARILVLLDQPHVAELVRLTLNHGVFETRDARNATEAMTIMAEWRPHVAIVDMELGVTKLLRDLGGSSGDGTRIPVVAFTRRGDLKTKLAAFEQGVDDIMTTPFSPEELLARVLVVTRRTYGHSVPLRTVIDLGDLELDILNRRVRVGGHEVHLTGMEQNLLYLLAANAGQIISRDQIMDTLWGAEYVPSSNTVDRHVRNLRHKLQDDYQKPRFVATVANQGYRFIYTGYEEAKSANNLSAIV